MRIPNFRLMLVILISISLASPVFAAKLKKKDGQTIDGKIRGVIVLKAKTKQDDTKSVYGFTYLLAKGEDVTAIDEEGVHVRGDMTLLGVTSKKPLD
ncbi:MAG: hypothetical protein ACREAB_04085, partial [Blastocatellia bacterium]